MVPPFRLWFVEGGLALEHVRAGEGSHIQRHRSRLLPVGENIINGKDCMGVSTRQHGIWYRNADGVGDALYHHTRGRFACVGCHADVTE